jgi:hypothetical protein
MVSQTITPTPYSTADLPDPDVDVVPAQRCTCARRRRTVHRCVQCGRPVCFHCQQPSIGGRCLLCVEPARAVRWQQRLRHGLLALAIAAVACAGVAATVALWLKK